MRKGENGGWDVRGEGHGKSYSHGKDLGICKGGKPLGNGTWKWCDVTCLNKIAAAWQRQKQEERLGTYCNIQVRKSQTVVSQVRTIAVKGWVFGYILISSFSLFGATFWKYSWQVCLCIIWNKQELRTIWGVWPEKSEGWSCHFLRWGSLQEKLLGFYVCFVFEGGGLFCFWWEQGPDKEFGFGHAKCGMSVRHPSWDVEKAVGDGFISEKSSSGDISWETSAHRSYLKPWKWTGSF